MQVQITEAFETSYLDNHDHKFVKMKQDNVDMQGDSTQDTGVKMTVFMVVNKDEKGDKEYGNITLKNMASGQS